MAPHGTQLIRDLKGRPTVVLLLASTMLNHAVGLTTLTTPGNSRPRFRDIDRFAGSIISCVAIIVSARKRTCQGGFTRGFGGERNCYEGSRVVVAKTGRTSAPEYFETFYIVGDFYFTLC
jgi:hypothetical protein